MKRISVIIILIILLGSHHLLANNLSIPISELNTVKTFNNMVKYCAGDFKYNIYAVDTHTEGQPTRIIISGLPKIKGSTMIERKNYLQKNYDFIRKSLLHEPRGHKDMFGAIITPPIHEEADFGIIFIDDGGYLDMCGHGTIGVMTAAVETGLVKPVEPVNEVNVDTPAGLIKGKAKVKGKYVEEVTIKNVPSFLYKKNVKIHVDEIGKIKVDISYGGNFFALVDADEIKIPIELKNIEKLTKIGLEIRDKINKKVKVKHPTQDITSVDLVEIYKHKGKNRCKNVVIFGAGQFDRSPCGTGTSAKLADLYTRGEIKENEVFINESITGSVFKGKIVGFTKVGKFNAVIPEITGRAWITGFNHYVIDPKDPLKYGFSIKKNSI